MYPKIIRKSTKNASGQLSLFALFEWLNIASLAQNLQIWHHFMVLRKFVLFKKLFTFSTAWHSHDAHWIGIMEVFTVSKGNSVQEACAKYFAVHKSKFEILQTTWKNKTKSIKMIDLLMKN